MADPAPVIYIVDDDEGVRQALSSLFRSVGLRRETFGSAREFLNARLADAPSCLVLDVRLPGLSGLDLQQELADRNIQIPIIFITGHADIPMSVQAMKAGAVEFLTNRSATRICWTPFTRPWIAIGLHASTGRNSGPARAYGSLTPREREVMHLVATRMLNKQIAAD